MNAVLLPINEYLDKLEKEGLHIDMAGAILSVPAIEFGIMGDEMLLIQSQIYDEIAIDGFFIMVPDVDSYVKILSALGISV